MLKYYYKALCCETVFKILCFVVSYLVDMTKKKTVSAHLKENHCSYHQSLHQSLMTIVCLILTSGLSTIQNVL